jgi:hypothetical protein
MNKSNMWIARGVATLLVGVILLGCSPGTRRLPPGTPPEKNDWYGEYYNEREYAECFKSMRTPYQLDCEFKRLTRVEEPEYWPYPNVPKPNWPEAPNPPVYRWGMSSKAYFEALCKAEAGEFIYRTVDNVEGFYQIRPRKQASWNALQDRYVMEDPYGHTNWEADDAVSIFVRPKFGVYRFFESPPKQLVVPRHRTNEYHPSMLEAPPHWAAVERHSVEDGNLTKSKRKEYDAELKSRYGLHGGA